MPVMAAYMVPHPPMIIPQVGKGSEKQVGETICAYGKVANEIEKLRPETIIVSSPHATMYADYFHISPGKEASGSFRKFGAPDVRFQEKNDIGLTKKSVILRKRGAFRQESLGKETGNWIMEQWCLFILSDSGTRIINWSESAFPDCL